MRKNLGSKRRKITDSARDEVTKIYNQMLGGESGLGEYYKIFDTQDFGYREVRVERPLKLNFQCTKDRLELLKSETAFLKLELDEQQKVIDTLYTKMPKELFKNRDKFETELRNIFCDFGFIPFVINNTINKSILCG